MSEPFVEKMGDSKKATVFEHKKQRNVKEAVVNIDKREKSSDAPEKKDEQALEILEKEGIEAILRRDIDAFLEKKRKKEQELNKFRR